MSQQTINIGTVPNDDTGDPLHTAGDKINDNFTELYAAIPTLGAGVATFLTTPSSANLSAAVTGETGTGALVFANSPALVTPILGVASATTVSIGGTGPLTLLTKSITSDVISLSTVINQRWAAVGNTSESASAVFTKTRGAAPDTHVIVQDGDSLGAINVYASDGVGYIHAGSILWTAEGTTGVNSTPTSFAILNSPGSGGTAQARLLISPEGTTIFRNNDALNTSVFRTLSVEHFTSGAAGAGIGAGIQFRVECAGGTRIGGAIDAVTTDVTNGSEDFDIVLSSMAGGAAAAERARILSTGPLRSGVASTITGGLQLAHASSANLTTIQPGNAAAAITYIWPTNVGAAGTVLTDAAGNGTLSWGAIIGRHTVGAAAGTLFPATTNGCAALAQAETATNKVNYKYLAFDAAAVEYAWLAIPTPKSYNASTVLMRAVWTHPATVTNFGVVWQFEIFAAANDDALDTAVGTAVTVTDTGGTTGDFYQADVSAAITPSNTPAKQDWLFVRVSRLATNGSDTMAVDAHLIGVEVYYTTDAVTDD